MIKTGVTAERARIQLHPARVSPCFGLDYLWQAHKETWSSSARPDLKNKVSEQSLSAWRKALTSTDPPKPDSSLVRQASEKRQLQGASGEHLNCAWGQGLCKRMFSLVGKKDGIGTAAQPGSLGEGSIAG